VKALTHVPGGILATKYGGKYALSLGILSTAIFTLITPTVIQWGNERRHVTLTL
jgi:MFS transporter, ACS family, solute carrier family 17 (sodium-dependent inorganic phosphate cotransporter), other